MTKKIAIGVVEGTKKKISIDLATLKQTRLLITADSGGGKTYLMKEIIEDAFHKIPIHVLDPEGEFAPLRELFDFFLIAKGGDSAPDWRNARSQAQKFLELRASVICDIYELPPKERIAFVAEYLHGLVEAPKSSRHNCLVIVDEAHIFAPEKGNVASSDAMADIASRGRKRGLILILATQRLSKLSKDVSSELRNRLIGPTFEDVNRERAAETLGIGKAGREEFFQRIKLLDAGHFFALGRAISKDLVVVKVNKIRSKHGEAAEKFNRTPPPARGKIAAMLKTIEELPREQAAAEESKADFRRTIAALRRDVETYRAEARKISIPTVDPKQTKAAIKRGILESDRKTRAEYAKAVGFLNSCIRVIVKQGKNIAVELRDLAELIARETEYRSKHFRDLADRVDQVMGKTLKKLEVPKFRTGADLAGAKADAVVAYQTPIAPKPSIVQVSTPIHAPARKDPQSHTISTNGDRSRTEAAILHSLAEIAAIGDLSPGKPKIAFFAGYSPTSSTFTSAIAKLVRDGAAKYEGNGVRIDPAIRESIKISGLSRETVDAMIQRIFSGSARRMLETIKSAYPNSLTKEDIATAIGASPTSSTFTGNLGDLRKTGFIEYVEGRVKMQSWLNFD